MYSRFRHAVPVAIVCIIVLCFLAGCEECPEGIQNSALTGYVLDAISGDGVSGADISAGDASDVTEEDGFFFLSGIESGDVAVNITADGYIDFETEIAIAEGETLEQDFTIVPEPEGNSAIVGHVLDAITGDPVFDADVSADGVTDLTDEDGWFGLYGLDAGDVTLEISCGGYIDFETEIAIAAAETLEQDFAIVPLSTQEEWRFILSWGLDPDDLDSHLWVPVGEGYYHVYYANDGYLDQEPYAQLDVDDVSSYGPETITVRPHNERPRLTQVYYEGEYVYAVKHYSGDLSIPESGAQVRIYHGNTLTRTISAPAGTAYDDWYWYVGRLNCRTGAWTLVNTYSITPPASLSGDAGTK